MNIFFRSFAAFIFIDTFFSAQITLLIALPSIDDNEEIYSYVLDES